jgi:hypothetical protein
MTFCIVFYESYLTSTRVRYLTSYSVFLTGCKSYVIRKDPEFKSSSQLLLTVEYLYNVFHAYEYFFKSEYLVPVPICCCLHFIEI